MDLVTISVLIILVGGIAAHNEDGVAPGGCPIPVLPYLTICETKEDTCRRDSDCERGERCCQDVCGLKCTRVVREKLGICPSLPAYKCDNVSHQCSWDSQCYGSLKCCQTSCGSRCVIPDPAVCPATRITTCPRNTPDLCTRNSDCGFNRKCCDDGCRKLCTIYQPKKGQCPKLLDPIKAGCPVDIIDRRGICELDDNCPLDQKCCDDGCSKKCTSPVALEIKPVNKICNAPTPWVPCKFYYNACYKDEHCPVGYTCCATTCGYRCKSTLPITKPPPPPRTTRPPPPPRTTRPTPPPRTTRPPTMRPPTTRPPTMRPPTTRPPTTRPPTTKPPTTRPPTTRPPRPVAIRICPKVPTFGLCFSVDYCSDDKTCGYYRKCCPTHCGKRCLQPIIRYVYKN